MKRDWEYHTLKHKQLFTATVSFKNPMQPRHSEGASGLEKICASPLEKTVKGLCMRAHPQNTSLKLFFRSGDRSLLRAIRSHQKKKSSL